MYCLVLVLACAGVSSTAVFAQNSSSSSNYRVTEMQFGSGSSLESCSEEYCAHTSIGEVSSGGESSSSAHTATFGSATTDEPLIEVIVDQGESRLGDLTTERTATKTMVVRVRNYLSGGYVMQVVGDPPVYRNHTLATPSEPSASEKGTEQFGLNVAANTDPNIGANPVQVPSTETSFGKASDSYKTPNLFKYESGDVVARSDSSSGRTDYTVSMIVNISNNTPAGHYSGDYSVVVVPEY